MTRAIGPRRSAPWNGPLRGAMGRGDTRAKRQDSTRSATVYMQGKQPTKHNISTVRLTTSNGVGKTCACEAAFCAPVTTESVTCEPGGRVGLASNVTPMHRNRYAVNMLTPFRAGRAGGARKFASLSGLVRDQGLLSPTKMRETNQ